MTVAERRILTAVARGAAPADLYLRGASLLSVYTGERYPASVAIRGERIAYVGLRDDMVGPRTRVVDLSGRTLVPGYIDAHVHPAHLVTPSALARHLLPLGTTTVLADTLQLWALGGLRAFRLTADTLARSPLKFYWMVRAQAQSRARDEGRRFRHADLVRAMAHPWALAVGEVTRWPEAWAGRAPMLRALDVALARGRRVEGHTAGASAERIPALAAAGFTSDHEPVEPAEVLARARHGIAVMLRHSSLRRDLPGLLAALRQAPGLAGRLMLTADGSMPAFVREHGFVESLVRLAMRQGVAALDAYRMVTLNPATYLGLDAHVGGIAPGRYADVCVLADLEEPRPVAVVARGRVVAEEGRLLARVPEPPWPRVLATRRARLDVRWRARADDLALPPRGRYPVARMAGAVITRLEERPLEPTDLRAALLDREGRWVAPGVVAGFADDLDGLASTITTDFNILALGRRPGSMARAVNRLLALRGGIVVVDGDRVVYEMPLPLGGLMARGSLGAVADLEDGLHAALTARGYPFHDPLFSLFFLTADFLPAVKLTPRGVWDVKRGRVLLPARRRGR